MKHVLLASIIVLVVLGIGTSYSQQSEIPSWIKAVAEFWVNDKTSDEEFVNAIEYLVNSGVINIDDAAHDKPNAAENDDASLPEMSSGDPALDQLRAIAGTFDEDNDLLANDYDRLAADYNELVDDYNELLDDYNELLDYENDLVDDYNELVDDYNKRYPITTISGTEVIWEFYDSKGNYYSWSMPITTYEDAIQYSRDYSIYQTYDNPKHVTLNGRTVPVLNLDGFAGQSFSDVIGDVYDNSHDDSDFVYEVWHIVSQLTVYDEDITPESEGRFALETFTRTGGDCEDLVILVADMLMSSSHTRHWDFQYVMMDSDDVLDPQDIDHVILYVDDGQYEYLIEATAPPSWDYYPNGVTGWWFEVV